MKTNLNMKTKIFFPFLLVIIMIVSSCRDDERRIKGSGPIVSQTIEMPDIKGVSLSIDANVRIFPGDTQLVVIEAQNNIIYNIEKYVTSDGIWRIGFHNSVVHHDGVTIFITTPHFDYAKVSGSGSVRTEGIFTGNTYVYSDISGSGNILMITTTENAESKISGSGDISLNGSADHHEINISGSGKVSAFGLETQRTDIRISGSGNCEVWTLDYLDVNISGSGSVYYKGYPQIVSNISGSGGIYNVNN